MVLSRGELTSGGALLFFQLRRKPAKASGVFRSLSHIVIMLSMLTRRLDEAGIP